MRKGSGALFAFSAAILSVVLFSLAGAHWAECAGPSSVTAEELKTMMESGEPVTVIDVRTPEEYSAGHIPGSVPINEIPDIGTYRYSGKIVLCCLSGRRSKSAAPSFAQKGIETIDLDGGLKAWIAAGGKVETGPYQKNEDRPAEEKDNGAGGTK